LRYEKEFHVRLFRRGSNASQGLRRKNKPGLPSILLIKGKEEVENTRKVVEKRNFFY
jgi:hypothetical protein